MSTATALLIASFFLCGWPLIAFAVGVWIGRRVDQLRSPFVMRSRRTERPKEKNANLPYG